MQWVQTAGGTADDRSNGIALDAVGNVYITGYFSGTASFGATSKTSAGSADIFIAKYSTAGTLQWVQTAGGSQNDISYGIALDASGNVYITGSFEGIANFGTISKTSAGFIDVFVAKYDPVGTAWSWVQTHGSAGFEGGQDLSLDGLGNVYLLGTFFGTPTFGTTTITSLGGADVFVAKYSNTGTIQWVKQAGGTSQDEGGNMVIDGSGNVYIAGFFGGTATFGSISKTTAGGSAFFLAKYNSSGNVLWVQSGGISCLGVAVDAIGGVFITGSFGGTAIFGSNSKTSAGNSDMYLVRLQQ